MKDVPKFTNKPNVYCSVCNLTKTKVMLTKQEHKRKAKTSTTVVASYQLQAKGRTVCNWAKAATRFTIARVRSNGK